MSDFSSSDSESSQDDSEYNFIMETEPHPHLQVDAIEQLPQCLDMVPYADEPIASEEWLSDYHKECEAKKLKEEEFNRRLDGRESVGSWCNCQKCDVQLLQNASECYCCHEMESCMSSLNDRMVIEECGEPPSCITLHPGFRPVCLEPWSLRLTADKYRCRDRKRYKKTGSEEGFLRSVAYREFTHLVHGYLGGKRIPLPACAYHAIRQTFREENEEFKGFEMDDE